MTVFDESGNGWIPNVGNAPAGSGSGSGPLDPDELADIINSGDPELDEAIQDVAGVGDQSGPYGTDDMFGMVGDGSTSNNAALLAIANYCASNPMATVVVPPGTYLINAPVEAGGPMRLAAAQGAYHPVIQAAPGFNVTNGRDLFILGSFEHLLSGLTVDGSNDGSKNLTGVYLFNGGSVELLDCIVKNTWNTAADAAGGQGFGLYGANLSKMLVSNCRFDRNTTPILAYADCKVVRIEGSLFINGHGDGITILGSAGAGASSVLIANNVLKDWATQNHLLTCSTAGARPSLVQLINNHCTGRDQAYSAGGNADLVSINGVRMLIVTGGVAELGGDYGWTFEDILECAVSGIVGRRNNSGGISFWKCINTSASALTAVDNYMDRLNEYDFGSGPKSGIHVWGTCGDLSINGWRSGNTTIGKQSYGLTAQDRNPNSGAVESHVGKITIGQGSGSNNRLGPLLWIDGQDKTAITHVDKVVPVAGDYPTTGVHTGAGCEIRLTRPVYAKPLYKTAIGNQSARVNTAAAAGATVLTVSAVLGGLAAGDHVSMTMNDGTTHHTTAAAGSSGTTLNITNAVPVGKSVPAGSPVVMTQYINGPNFA